VENRDKAARSFTIEFEFLDKTGAVVEFKDKSGAMVKKYSLTVGPVAANAMVTFNVEIDKGGVAGVRYALLP